MLGAIIGDMVGSIYEFDPIKSKEFNVYDKRMHMTDDSLLTLAVAKVLMSHYPIKYDERSLRIINRSLMKEFARVWKNNQEVSWGNMFSMWCKEVNLKGHAGAYNSFGNGAAMRISPVGWIAKNEEELKVLSKAVTGVTHNHAEGIKGAEAVAMCIYLALKQHSKELIKERMVHNYYPEIADMDFNNLVKNYDFDETCQGSAPEAIYCFLISESLEDAIRNCIAIGGDCDTTAAIAGSIAEAYYKTRQLSALERYYLNRKIENNYKKIIHDFYNLVGHDKIKKEKKMSKLDLDIIESPVDEAKGFDVVDFKEQEFANENNEFNFVEREGGNKLHTDFVKFAHERGIVTVGQLIDNADKLLFEFTHDNHLLEHQINDLKSIMNEIRSLI